MRHFTLSLSQSSANLLLDADNFHINHDGAIIFTVAGHSTFAVRAGGWDSVGEVDSDLRPVGMRLLTTKIDLPEA